jgi:uncharacterized lipoprotein YajG
MKSQRYLIISAIFIAFLVPACGPKIIKIEPIPKLEGGSILRQIDSLTFIINEVKDGRPELIKTVLFNKGDGSHDIVNSSYDPRLVGIEPRVKDIVAQAITAELMRNGHKMLGPKNLGNADVVIDITIQKYWCQTVTGFWTVNYKGRVETFVKMAMPLDSDEVFTKTYGGSYDDIPALAGFGPIKGVLNEALLNMIKDFTTDPELLDFLQKVKEN